MTNATEPVSDRTLPLRAAVPRPPRKGGVGLSLRYKIFGAVALLVVAIVAAVLAAVQLRATAVVRRSIDAGMRKTGAVWGGIEEESFQKLLGAAKQLADDPNTKAALTNGDPATLWDYLESKRQEAVAADSLMILDRVGNLLARTDERGATGIPFAGKSPLFDLPLEGKSVRGWSAKGGMLRQNAAVPVLEGANVVGVLVIAKSLGAENATRAKDVSSAEATFLLKGEKGLTTVASTLGKEGADRLAAALGSHGELVDPALREGKVAGPTEIALGDDANVLIAVPLTSASGERLGLFVASRSLWQEMAGYRQIRDTIVGVGGGAILAALLLSLFLAHRITRPLRALAEATEQIKEGNLDVEIPEAPNDEIGLLTGSFAKMLVDLRQKAEMEEYLKSLTLPGVGGVTAVGGRGRLTLAGASPIGAGQDTVATALMERAGGATAEIREGALFHGRYEIAQVLGAGAMGMVYRARDRELDEEVAIKTIRGDALASDPTAIERFKQEIKLARKITNKHVLRTYDFGEADGIRFITMEYMKSVTLKYLLEQKKAMPLGPGLHLAKQICDGLAAAHEQGVIHRDIKPQNMLVNPRGDLKIMDFGISRLAGKESGMTQEGMVIGTPDYMSPEQAQGRPLDARSDIYSVGVVLYEIFCGRLPFSADTVVALVLKHIQEAPPAPRSVNPALPAELEAIIVKAMEKDPARRYASIGELYDALGNVAS